MEAWNQLARLALIGTEHQQPEAPALGDPEFDAVLTHLATAKEREEALLKTSAALVLARRAGHQPVKPIVVATAVAEPETLPRCPEAAGRDLGSMLRDYQPQVLPEWLTLAAARGMRAPEELLPELLTYGVNHRELRPVIKSVLGKRGAWLARQNDGWSFALETGDVEKSWQEGKRAERAAALRDLRKTNTARARELLVQSWKDEPPDNRVEFLPALATNLSLEDEPFLETTLDDKRKEVRALAIRLLGSLPDSQLVQRLTAIATPLIKAKKKLLGGVTLEIELPAECTKAMARDGIGGSVRPGQNVGEKSWWLKEMLEAIPPAHWTRTLGLTPKELLTAAGKSEWAQVVRAGWAVAVGRYRDREWTQAWLDLAAGNPDVLDFLHDLLPTSGAWPEDSENLFLEVLRAGLHSSAGVHVAGLLGRLPRPWSEGFSRQMIGKMQTNYEQLEKEYGARAYWQQYLKIIALGVPPNLSESTANWPPDAGDNVRQHIDEFCATIEFRRGLHRHFGPTQH